MISKKELEILQFMLSSPHTVHIKSDFKSFFKHGNMYYRYMNGLESKGLVQKQEIDEGIGYQLTWKGLAVIMVLA